MMQGLAGLWLLAVAILVMYLDPVQSIRLAAFKRFIIGFLVALLWGGACLQIGAFAWKRLKVEGPVGWDQALLLGLGCWGVLLFLPATLGWLGHLTSGAVLMLMLLTIRHRAPIRWPVVPWWGWAICAIVACWVVIEASAPAIDTDAVYFHLALPKQMWLQGELLGGFLHPNASRPMLLHLPYAALFGWGGESAISLFHGLLSLALLLSVVERGEQWHRFAGLWAVVLMLGSWSFVLELGLASNNLPTAFACWLTMFLCFQLRYTAAAIFAAIALSLKFTAIGPLVGIWALLIQGWKHRAKVVVVVVLCMAIWPLWNWGHDLHPLFPYVGWPQQFPFQYLEKYGMGRDVWAFLLLPWNVIMYAEVDKLRFLGRLNPLLLGAIPLLFPQLWQDGKLRKLAVVVLIAAVFWALGPHWIRHLLPMFPLLVLVLGVALARAPRGLQILAFAVWFVGLWSNATPFVERIAHRWPAALGQLDADRYRAQHVRGWQTMRWASNQLPEDAVPAILFAWAGVAMDRPYVMSSVEDHVPVRHWLLHYQHDALDQLKKQGVTHLVIGNDRFLGKSYPFVSKKDFQALFVYPTNLLAELLVAEAELVYAAEGYKVYRLLEKRVLVPE